MEIRTIAYPKATLIGNPSDGFFGKTIAFTFKNFNARALLMESQKISLVPTFRDRSEFSSIYELEEEINLNGYYGGIRLMKAVVKIFSTWCRENEIKLHERNFTLKYESDIPPHVGLSGSSAIVTACLRALMMFYNVEIPKAVQANLILAVEKNELGIQAGLQDRVAQVFEMPVYMDFHQESMKKKGFGNYVPIPKEMLPPLYIAFRTDLPEDSEAIQSDLRKRFDAGETTVHQAMEELSSLTVMFMNAMREGNLSEMNFLLNQNLDLLCTLYDIGKENKKMIRVARELGASAKFTGNGGAIIGICKDDQMLLNMREKMAEIGVEVIKPEVV